MVKNYLVSSVRPVIKKWYPGNENQLADNNSAANDYQLYQHMARISQATARKFLSGTWELISFSAPVLDARMYQIAQWYQIKELWFREPCNILSMTADTMFIKPTDIWEQYSEMRLFNHTDPRSHQDVGAYFNDAVTYFPSTMMTSTWELGERRMEDWFTHSQSRWDCGQLIHNHMFAAEYPDKTAVPELNWQMFFNRPNIEFSNAWNTMPIQDAKILHFNGSRGPATTVAIMQQIIEELGVCVD
jgi:hypothetical protein